MDGFYMFLYIMEIPFTMDLGNGGYPKNIQVVGYDQWEHHRKWAAQMDWNLHIWGFVWEFSTPIAMVLNLISSIHYNGRKFM